MDRPVTAAVFSDLFGSALPSLDPQRTSEHRSTLDRWREKKEAQDNERLERNYRAWAGTVQHACPVETAFRHRGWFNDRRRVRAVMVAAGVPAARLEKFDHCGAACRIEAATDGSGVRLKASYCGDRWCNPCCKARAVRILAGLVSLGRGRKLTFATFTSKPAGETFAECLQHVLDSFKRLRASRGWREAVQGGAATVEVTRGRAGTHWHVHIHCLFTGKFIDQRSLSELWRVASRGSYIVDIRAVRDDRRHLEYVASYAAKGWSRDVLKDHDAASEAMIGLKGRRLMMTFGEWYGVELDREPPDQREFRSVGSLSFVVARAAAGEEWAIGLMRSLGVAVEGGDGSVRFGPAG